MSTEHIPDFQYSTAISVAQDHRKVGIVVGVIDDVEGVVVRMWMSSSENPCLRALSASARSGVVLRKYS